MPVIRRRHCVGCGRAVDPNSKCAHCGTTHGVARTRERQRLAGRNTEAWRKLRAAAIARDGRCICTANCKWHAGHPCGSTQALTVHHLRYPARTLADCETICRRCHGSISANMRDIGARIH